MGFYDKSKVDEEKIVALLKDAVSKVKTEEDPLVLNEYKKLFKKNVPFSLRMYVAAYLTKNSRFDYRPRRDFNKDRFRSTQENTRKPFNSETTEERTRHRTVIDESVAATIFISVGRNRRVFPRDLIHLIVNNASIARERIGDIRVLDNYSFVQLFSEDADGVIEKLNGTNYRGRPLQVSYSRKKDELLEDESTITEEVITQDENFSERSE